ncbi:HAMP domain-containing sensor histidine kinase [Marinicrinis sediminis]|uniref:histidine kinase n=1 Tax=Marinicrinis sediminis TaxID=1652465 RepID=A0ABW5R8Z3_9BACL
MLIQPIREMTIATRKMAKGDFSYFIPNKRKDELGQLTNSFNEMTRDLGHLEEMRHEFVTNVSHEIQSPLTSIRGFAKALREGIITDPEEQKQTLDIIEQESTRLSQLGKHLLQLAELESEQPAHQPRPYALDEQIRRVVNALEPHWREKGHKLEIRLPARLALKGDEQQLEQVWINFLMNAIRYTPPGGQITVTGKAEEQEILIRITDNGIGLSEEDLPHIFERFYKADKSRARQDGGNGLGLAITRRIVLLHGGTIAADSTLGSGTTFTIRLPR